MDAQEKVWQAFIDGDPISQASIWGETVGARSRQKQKGPLERAFLFLLKKLH
jgi:hypothetical protein